MTSRRPTALKLSAYALLMIAVFILQSARATSVSFWGAWADGLPGLVAAIALFEGPYVGGCFGFAAGMMTAVHSPMVEGLSALYLGLFGIAFGLVGAHYLRRVMPAALLGGLGCILVQGVLRYIFYFRLVYQLDIRLALRPLLAELALALAPGVLTFYAVRWLHRRFSTE